MENETERIEAEQRDEAVKKANEEKEKIRLDSIKPDIDKIKQFFATLSNIPLPECSSELYKEFVLKIGESRKQWLLNEFNKMPK